MSSAPGVVTSDGAVVPFAKILTADEEAQFRREMAAAIPRLTSCARGLTRGSADMDDLVQATLEKAWKSRASFHLGTNIVAWLCFICRNQFYSDRRRAWRWVSMPVIVGKDGSETSTAEMIPVPPSQGDNLDLEELREAMSYMPAEMAAAISLIAIDGLSYEEAANELNTEIGTVKSRVSRGRRLLDVYFGLNRREEG